MSYILCFAIVIKQTHKQFNRKACFCEYNESILDEKFAMFHDYLKVIHIFQEEVQIQRNKVVEQLCIPEREDSHS